MLADGGFGGLDQLLGQLGADEVAAVVAQLGQSARRGTSESVRGGISGQQAGGEHAVEAADIAGELGKAEIDQTVQLAHAVVEILAQPVTMAHQLTQRLGDLVMQLGGLRPLFEGEAGEALGVDSIRLGTLEAAVLEAAGDETG